MTFAPATSSDGLMVKVCAGLHGAVSQDEHSCPLAAGALNAVGVFDVPPMLVLRPTSVPLTYTTTESS